MGAMLGRLVTTYEKYIGLLPAIGLGVAGFVGCCIFIQCET
jgi:hypothetical protein